MKANLMIGDWVMHNDPIHNGEKVQVKEIYGDGYFAVDGGLTKTFDPIPLTTEILRKNGLFHDPYLNDVEDCDGDNFLPCHFEEDEEGDLELIKENGKIYWSIECGEYYIIELRYVHQLQHALKLCGIDKEIKL